MHVYGMTYGQMIFKSLPLVDKKLVLAQVFVAVVAIRQMRVFPESDMDAMYFFQVL
jgi:hypothetical protein